MVDELIRQLGADSTPCIRVYNKCDMYFGILPHGEDVVCISAKSGEGKDIRQSQTVDRSTCYYAVRLPDGSVLRVGKEASSIWSVYMRALPLILILMLAMIGMGALGAGKLTDRLMEPIMQMTENLQDTGTPPRYPELEPFMSKIEKQHEEILKNASMRVEFTANVSSSEQIRCLSTR